MNFSLINHNVADGASYVWTGKVWLPTYTQMGGGQNNNTRISITEGKEFSKFTYNSARVKTLHPNCAANNEFCKVNNYASGKNCWYLMSSADPSESYNVRIVNYDGSIDSSASAYSGIYGFAPCICIPRTGWSDPSKAPDLNYTT